MLLLDLKACVQSRKLLLQLLSVSRKRRSTIHSIMRVTEESLGTNPFRYPAQTSGVGGWSLQILVHLQVTSSKCSQSGLRIRNPYLCCLLLSSINNRGESRWLKPSVNVLLAWPWTLFVKRTLLGNPVQKQIKAMKGSSGDLELYAGKSLFAEPLKCTRFWSSETSACVGVIQRVSSSVCVIQPHCHGTGLAELNLHGSNLDCYSHPTSITIPLPSKPVMEAPGSSQWWR